MISVYITCKDGEQDRIARRLLDKGLIACANIFPVTSMYKWKGKTQRHGEIAMLCKARKANFPAIEREVKRLHSYKTPCIVAFEWAKASSDYAQWVKSA